MKNSLKPIIILLLCSVVTFISCKKSSVDSQKRLSVFLTDDPSQYESVWVDIKVVEVKIDENNEHENDDKFGDNDKDDDDDNLHHDQYGKWDTLSFTPRVYNLMTLRNGVDMLLGTASINGKIRKIRITLGTNNYLYQGGVKYPLNLLPGTNNYLYVKIHDEDEDDENNNGLSSNIWIDFDISRSIIEQNGQFYLKPVLKPFSKKYFGAIKGKVFPQDALPLVSATNSVDAGSAIPEKDGGYDIEGLREGTYTVKFSGHNLYHDVIINNIVVQKGKKTELPNVTLTK